MKTVPLQALVKSLNSQAARSELVYFISHGYVVPGIDRKRLSCYHDDDLKAFWYQATTEEERETLERENGEFWYFTSLDRFLELAKGPEIIARIITSKKAVLYEEMVDYEAAYQKIQEKLHDDQ
jgi:hypothetical protein